MPIYYNNGLPNGGSSNSINNTATSLGLRDFLLHKNIQNPIVYPQLSTSINGAPKGGEPFLDTSQGHDNVVQQVSIEVDGIFRYGNAIVMNQYKESDSTAGELVNIDEIKIIPIFPVSPSGTGTYEDEDITQYGLLPKSDYMNYRKNATLKNLYVDSANQIDMADYISLQVVQSQQLGNYYDEYGALNDSTNLSTPASDILGNALNAQNINTIPSAGLTNYDIKAALASRSLTSSSTLNDTKLGIIGGQQLALTLANNAAFNMVQDLQNTLNVSNNILSLVQGNGLAGLSPDYTITVPSTTGGQIVNYVDKVLGFYIPQSFLTDDGSIFSSENGNVGNIQRANSMLSNTGQGQIKALTDQFNANIYGTSIYDNPNNSPFRSGYAPGFAGSNGPYVNPNLYAFGDADGNVINFLNPINGVIPELSYNRPNMSLQFGFDDFTNNVNNNLNSVGAFATDFTWTSNSGGTVNAGGNSQPYAGNSKSLLAKTQLLFNSRGMKTIVSTAGDMTIGNYYDPIQTSVVKGGISRGSNVLQSSNFDAFGGLISNGSGSTADNVFCRTWTPFNRYDSVSKLIRRRGLNQSEQNASTILNNYWRTNYENQSVLDDNGFVKIAPYVTDDLTRNAGSVKKYMFSIENLAWVGSPAVNLLPVEQGPGDLLTGKFGRIMWFPPYDLSFNESSSVSLESNIFIGRGEPLYTYNNTERTGQLSFKIITDHSSIMNSFSNDQTVTEEFIRSWIAGCTDLDDSWANKLTLDEITKQDNKNNIVVTKANVNPVQIMPTTFNIYFKNDCTDVDTFYEAAPNGDASLTPSYQSNIQLTYRLNPDGSCSPVTPYNTNWTDTTSFGLNSDAQPLSIGSESYPNGWTTPGFMTALSAYLNGSTFTNYKINITVDGYASSQGCPAQNVILAQGRADNTAAFLKAALLNGGGGATNNITIISNQASISSVGVNGGYTNNPNVTPQSQQAPKADRFAKITFAINYTNTVVDSEPAVNNVNTNTVINQQVKKRFYTEADFFEKMKQTDPFIFDKLSQKIRYFNPAFHSITPEGFNSRLTFLLQCTRQGPTISDAQNPTNLAFGPPPVCILRVGDFYNTKIMIDNITFDFQEPQWDLNPEGIGVQPMIATVNISFKYIGGSSLSGPINKLQNALSFNYFANTQVYDPRSDYITQAGEINKINNNNNFPDKRDTFGTTDSLENNYGLVLGLDITQVSMNSDSNIVPTDTVPSKDVDQTAASDNATNTQSAAASDTPSSNDDAQILFLPTANIKFVSNTVNNTGQSLQFTISIVPNQNISQNYSVQVAVRNVNDSSVVYSIPTYTTNASNSIVSKQLTSGPNGIFSQTNNAGFTYKFTSFNPGLPSSVFTDNNQYYILVTLLGQSDNNTITLRGNITKS